MYKGYYPPVNSYCTCTHGRVRVFMGKGMGSPQNTWGLPMPITSHLQQQLGMLWWWWLVICSPFHHSHHPSLSLSSLLHYNTSTLWAGACSSGFSWSCHPRHGCAILVLSCCYSVREVEVVLGWLVVVVQTQTMCNMDDATLEYPFLGNAKRDLKENSKVSQGVLKVLRPFKLLTAVICLHVAYIV